MGRQVHAVVTLLLWSPFVLSVLVIGAQADAAFDRGRPTYDEWKERDANKTLELEADASRDAKMAAVNQVVTLLEDLQGKVLREGEQEAKSYNKFACFCKDTLAEKTAAIKDGQDSLDSLRAKLLKFQDKRSGLDKKVAGLRDDVSSEEKKMKAAEAKRRNGISEFEANMDDLTAGLFALQNAMKELKVARRQSFMQLASLVDVRQAVLQAEVLGFVKTAAQRRIASFLQGSSGEQKRSPPTSDYEFGSDDIIDMLEKLEKDMRDEKNKADKEETKARADYDMFMQKHANAVKVKENDIDVALKAKSDLNQKIPGVNEEITTISATLKDDQDYAENLWENCHHKAESWDKRSSARQQEISVLTKVLESVKNSIRNKISGATVRLTQHKVKLSIGRARAVANDSAAMQAIEASAEADEGEHGSDSGKAVVAKVKRSSKQLSHAEERPISIMKKSAPSTHASSESMEAQLQALRAENFALKQRLGLPSASAIAAPSLLQLSPEIPNNDSLERFIHGIWKKKELNSEESSLTAQRSDSARQNVVSMLRRRAEQLHSTLLTAVASQASGDTFEKVKRLIEGMIERLLQQANEEITHKGYCDKAVAEVEQKRDFAAESILELNSELAQLEVARKELRDNIRALRTEIPDLRDSRQHAMDLREAEEANNEETVNEAQAGLDAISNAHDTLVEFYKTADAGDLDDPSLLQQRPVNDAPDAGFDDGEDYKGAQGEAGGVIGMLEVIKSDFQRTISETEETEAQAKRDYRDFMTATSASLAEKETAEDQLKRDKSQIKVRLASLQNDLDYQTVRLKAAINEAIELKPTCGNPGISYEERVRRREEEIESLKQALDILRNYAD